ncbi:hypothetical protein BBP40_000441 [Aspergillus hancockii]|nr:hypothetical protein BBP40_000441 [Aspergillus hancockii]
MKSVLPLLMATFTQAALQQPLSPSGSPKARSDQELESIVEASPLLAFHRNIVEIESISNNEKSVGNFIANFLKLQNFTVEKQLVVPGSENQKERFNIYAYFGRDRHPDILLTSHIDTVPPFIPYSLHAPNSSHDGSFKREDVVIAGRGSVDAKASVAALIFAALEMRTENRAASLGLLLDVGEENSGIGMKHFSDSELNPAPASFHTVIFGEPTNLSLVAGHKGNVAFKLVAKGKAAHSGYPWLGKSAISAILPVLSFLNNLEDVPPEEGGLLRSEKFGKSTLNIGLIAGGVAGNVVPNSAEAIISVRLAAGTPDDTRDIIRRAIGKVTGEDDGVYPDFASFNGGSLPQHLDTDVDGFNVITVNYGTDVPSLKIHNRTDRKVKRYLYGPGSIHVAHGDDEALTVGELEAAVRGYKKLIAAAVERG